MHDQETLLKHTSEQPPMQYFSAAITTAFSLSIVKGVASSIRYIDTRDPNHKHGMSGVGAAAIAAKSFKNSNNMF